MSERIDMSLDEIETLWDELYAEADVTPICYVENQRGVYMVVLENPFRRVTIATFDHADSALATRHNVLWSVPRRGQ